MYAVIRTGGKQYKVTKGDVLEVEHIKLKSDQDVTNLTPVLVVTDDGKTISGLKDLSDYRVGVKVLGDTKGDKVTVFKYRNKTGYASKSGHRQLYSLIEITSIGDDGADAQAPAAKAAKRARRKQAPAAETAPASSDEAVAGKPSTPEPAEAPPATLDGNGS